MDIDNTPQPGFRFSEAGPSGPGRSQAFRTRSQEEANRVEAGWKESTRRFAQTRHQEYVQGWFDHHERQLAALEETFSVLTARHRAERDRYGRILGIGGAEAQPMDGAEDGPEVA
jgi:hypothetical protein